MIIHKSVNWAGEGFQNRPWRRPARSKAISDRTDRLRTLRTWPRSLYDIRSGLRKRWESRYCIKFLVFVDTCAHSIEVESCISIVSCNTTLMRNGESSLIT